MALQLFKIETVEVSNPVTAVTFSSIPQGYTDLKLVMSTRTSSTTPESGISFNGVTTNLSDIVLYSYSGATGSNSSTPIRTTATMSTQTANTFSNTDAYIPNYTSSNNKTISVDTVAESNETSNAFLYLTAGRWASTAAITSLTVTATLGFFVGNSTFTLYGVL